MGDSRVPQGCGVPGPSESCLLCLQTPGPTGLWIVSIKVSRGHVWSGCEDPGVCVPFYAVCFLEGSSSHLGKAAPRSLLLRGGGGVRVGVGVQLWPLCSQQAFQVIRTHLT